MYHGLRQVGVRLQGKYMMSETSIATRAAKEHFLRIGGEPNHAPDGLGLALLPDLPPDETLSKTPSHEKCWGAVRDMKESAGGKDEVTIGLVKEALAATRLDIYILVRTWNADETAEFDALALRAVVIMLWKRKCSKEDCWTSTE